MGGCHDVCDVCRQSCLHCQCNGGVLIFPLYVDGSYCFIFVGLQESQVKRIFGSMISQKLDHFPEDIKAIAGCLTEGTIEMYNAIVQNFLPTPAKIHYLFNLRDISRVWYCILCVMSFK